LGKLDAVLKVSIIAAALLGSCSIAYYYLAYLPQRDAQLDLERKQERKKVDAEKRAAAQRAAAEQRAAELRAAEQREAEQQAAEQRQAAEKVAAQLRYLSCLSQASDNYDAMWAGACKRSAEVNNDIMRNRVDCIHNGIMSKADCEAIWKLHDGSANCALPRGLEAT